MNEVGNKNKTEINEIEKTIDNIVEHECSKTDQQSSVDIRESKSSRETLKTFQGSGIKPKK